MTTVQNKAAQDKVVAELKAAAEKRHACPLELTVDEVGVTVRKLPSDDNNRQSVLEEYLWNSAGSMLVRVCYVVWEHIVGEDHQWGRFSTHQQAEQRIAALFSASSLGTGEYYITRLYTTQPPE